ncbi:hypothetical protein KJ359_005682 [Pestalotiopsis sp. 9143b]|nr:hypothetical protein KJ359_005682 [Pestalotiopsis sp. 9143b]
MISPAWLWSLPSLETMDPFFLVLICIFQCIAIAAVCVMIRDIFRAHYEDKTARAWASYRDSFWAYYQYKAAKSIAPYKFPWKHFASIAPRPKLQTLKRADMLAEVDQLRREQKNKETALRKEFEAAKHQFLQRSEAISKQVTAKNAEHEAATQYHVADTS